MAYVIEAHRLLITCSPILYLIYVEQLYVDVLSKVKMLVATVQRAVLWPP